MLAPSATAWPAGRARRPAPGRARGVEEDFFDGRGALLPLDVADGAAFRRNASSDDLWDWLRSGGFLVWPILLVGVVGLGLGLVRFITLGSSRAFSETRMREIVERVERGEIAKAKEYCARGGKSRPAACWVAPWTIWG